MNINKINKVIIIGSGPAGYTAAIYAARAMLEPVLIAGSQPGGQLTITNDVENFPGFADVVQGPWLMEQMKEQALKVGTKFIEDHISSVNFNKKPFEIIGDSGTHYFAESVIISTGAQARWLNLESEEKYKGFGVSACATCDGFFYKNKDVVVVGGGNSAVEESLFLTNFAKKVTLIHRKSELKKAEKFGADILKYCVKVGGVLTGEHGVGIEKNNHNNNKEPIRPNSSEKCEKTKSVWFSGTKSREL